MRFLAFLLIFSVGSTATANEALYQHEPSGMTIEKSEVYDSLKANGMAFTFGLAPKNIYFLRGQVMEIKPGVTADQLNKLFVQSTAEQYDVEIVNTETAPAEFKTGPREGSIYAYTNVVDERPVCEFSMVHPLKANHFLVMTLTTQKDACKEAAQDSILNHVAMVYENISVQ